MVEQECLAQMPGGGVVQAGRLRDPQGILHLTTHPWEWQDSPFAILFPLSAAGQSSGCDLLRQDLLSQAGWGATALFALLNGWAARATCESAAELTYEG